MRLKEFDFCRKPKPPRKKKEKPKKFGRLRQNRVRERFEEVNEDFFYTHLQTTGPGGSSLPMPEPMSFHAYSFWERMVDNTGLRNKQNRIDHIKWRQSFERPPTVHDVHGSVVALNGFVPNDLHNYVYRFVPSPGYERIEQLAKQAEDHFRRTVRPTVQLLNFVAELRELCLGKAEEVTKFAAKLEKAFADYWVFLAKHPEDFYLAYEFFLKPFEADFRKILCSVSEAHKRLQWLINNNGKAVEVEYRIGDVFQPDLSMSIDSLGQLWSYGIGGWDPVHPPWEGGIAPLRLDSADRLELHYRNYKVVFCAQATVLFQIPEYKLRDGGVLLVWESMMGLDRPLAALWEGTLFSFVVDWFTDCADDFANWLDESVFVAWPDAQILRADHSFKLTTDVHLIQQKWDGSNYHPVDLGKATYSRYKRDWGLPYGVPELFHEPVNIPRVQLLSAALILQLSKRAWRKWLRRRLGKR